MIEIIDIIFLIFIHIILSLYLSFISLKKSYKFWPKNYFEYRECTNKPITKLNSRLSNNHYNCPVLTVATDYLCWFS